MGVEILVPLGFFAMIVAIVVVPTWFKNKERREVQKTLRSAIDKGQPLPPEIIEALSRDTGKPPATATRDLRTGVILLAVSAGIAMFGYMVNFEEGDALFPLVGIAAIPGAIGLAFVILSFFNKNKG